MKVYIVNLDIDIYKKGRKKNNKCPIRMDLAMFQRTEIFNLSCVKIFNLNIYN
jgi:hypothetical protein